MSTWWTWNELLEEKIGSSIKSQDQLRAFYLFSVRLEMFKIGFVSHIRVKLSGFTITVVHKKHAVSVQGNSSGAIFLVYNQVN